MEQKKYTDNEKLEYWKRILETHGLHIQNGLGDKKIGKYTILQQYFFALKRIEQLNRKVGA